MNERHAPQDREDDYSNALPNHDQEQNMTLPRSFDEMSESKFLKQDDVESPKLLTIANFTRENMAAEGEPPEYKWTMHFREQGVKPMVLGPTNRELLKMALGVGSPADAIDRQIVVFRDPTVSYAGKITGGIRLRAPKNQKPAIDPLDEEIPF